MHDPRQLSWNNVHVWHTYLYMYATQLLEASMFKSEVSVLFKLEVSAFFKLEVSVLFVRGERVV